jgi:hypothetical protein
MVPTLVPRCFVKLYQLCENENFDYERTQIRYIDGIRGGRWNLDPRSAPFSNSASISLASVILSSDRQTGFTGFPPLKENRTNSYRGYESDRKVTRAIHSRVTCTRWYKDFYSVRKIQPSRRGSMFILASSTGKITSSICGGSDLISL